MVVLITTDKFRTMRPKPAFALKAWLRFIRGFIKEAAGFQEVSFGKLD